MNLSRSFRLRVIATLVCGTLLSIVPDSIITAQDSQPNTGERLVKLEIKQRSILDGLTSIRVGQGESIRLHWTSDEAVVLHLHGYDIKEDVPKGGEAVIEFNANATGRFLITSHQPAGEGNDSHSNHMPSDMNSSEQDGHGDLFESETLVKGDMFSFIIPSDMEDTEIPYHDHMAHEQSALIIVSGHHGREGTVAVKVADSPHMYQPVEVTVKPGSTVEWTIEKDAKVRLTSGIPPATDHDSPVKEGAHGEHEEQEKTLVAIEVRP